MEIKLDDKLIGKTEEQLEEFNKKLKHHFNTPKMMLMGFGIAILIGALILMLPISQADGNWTSFIDALFTSTTSVCVTGLTVVPTYLHWSTFGKIVILLLIQLGGLGVISLAMGIFIIVGKRITLKERMLIQDVYNMDSPKGMVRMVVNIFKGTMVIELIGAVLYSLKFIPEFGVGKGIIYSIFHSISAFCNAGIDIIDNNSFVPYQDSVIINLTTMFLIVLGGIGFIVWWDLWHVLKDAKKNRVWKGFFARLELHSKLAIVMTAILILGGGILILIMEYTNGATIGNMHLGNKIMSSLFESVTTRTAGFASIPQENFREGTTLILIILMVIGGSPMGTAGGIKTTTVAMIIICIRGTINGRKDTEAYGRKISSDNIKSGIAVAGIFIFALFIGIILLSVTQEQPITDIMFEASSAVATVGLTRGMTGTLDTFGKTIIILLMFMGRIGPITMAMAFNIRRSSARTSLRELPEKKILVG